MAVQLNLKTLTRGIEWCDVTRPAFRGCQHRCRWLMPNGELAKCYAEEIATNGVAKTHYPDGFETHYIRDMYLSQLSAGRDPSLIFIDSMADFFGAWVPEEHITAALDAMGKAPHHVFQSLTKAPARIDKFLELLPSNLWVGVSSPPDFMMPAGDNDIDAIFDGSKIPPARPLSEATKRRFIHKTIKVLRNVKYRAGNIVWMSLEPVSWDMVDDIGTEHPLDWVVIGAASAGKTIFQPDPAHIQNLLNLFDATETPVFFKGNLRSLFDDHDFGNEARNRWREDFPVAYRDGTLIPAVLRRQERAIEFDWPMNTHLLEWQRKHPHANLSWRDALERV